MGEMFATTGESPEGVAQVVARLVADGAASGFVVAVARGDGPVAALAVGADAAGRPLDPDSLFPFASITKLATALAVLRLMDMGALDVADPLARHLPDAAAAREGVTLRHLLCHTAGLPFDPPEARAPGDDPPWPAQSEAARGTTPVAPPGTLVRYSAVGYALLALVVERATGRPFPAALAELVLAPLGLGATFGVAPACTPARIAEADWYNAPGWPMLANPSNGMVGTAADALALVRAFRPGILLRPETCAAATRDQTGGLAAAAGMFWPRAPWGLGPGLKHDLPPFMFAPPAAGPAAYAHGGAAGGLAWADPDADIAAAILSTRAGGPWFSDTMAAISAAILNGRRS